MRNPYKAARERFGYYWMFFSFRNRLYAMHLVTGEMFWTAVRDWAQRMQTKWRRNE